MNKKLVKKILLFLLMFLICFIYSFFFTTVYNDEIWNYGFSYNIASGLVPYRDFNLVVTPLYSFISSVFIKIFGNYLISLHLFNGIILSIIILIFFNKLKYRSFILIPFLAFVCYPSYNILCLLLFLLLINIVNIEFKFKDFLLGLLVGIIFLTKQHIGFCFVVPMIYYSRNKIKALFGFCVPICLLIIYLIFNNAFFEFVDYCFWGLFEFGNSNSILLFLPIEIIICLIIFYNLYKSKFRNEKLFYLLMFQIISIPICDDYHFMLAFVPVLYYLLIVSSFSNYKIKYYSFISLFLFLYYQIVVHGFVPLNFYNDKDSYLYGRNIPKYVNLDVISNFIKGNENVYDHIYFFSKNAYYVKLNVHYKLDKFDLINNGNMGYNGANKFMKEIESYCKNNNCMFILYKYEFNFVGISQTNRDIVNFVIDNYYLKEEVDVFDVYINY